MFDKDMIMAMLRDVLQERGVDVDSASTVYTEGLDKGMQTALDYTKKIRHSAVDPEDIRKDFKKYIHMKVKEDALNDEARQALTKWLACSTWVELYEEQFGGGE